MLRFAPSVKAVLPAFQVELIEPAHKAIRARLPPAAILCIGVETGSITFQILKFEPILTKSCELKFVPFLR
jgi:hypothetical protein